MQVTTADLSVPSRARQPARFCSVASACSRIGPRTIVPLWIGPWPARNASRPSTMTPSENGASPDGAARRPVIIGCAPARWSRDGAHGLGPEREVMVGPGADHLRQQAALEETAGCLRPGGGAVLDQDRAAQHGAPHLARQLPAVPQRVLDTHVQFLPLHGPL